MKRVHVERPWAVSMTRFARHHLKYKVKPMNGETIDRVQPNKLTNKRSNKQTKARTHKETNTNANTETTTQRNTPKSTTQQTKER